MNTDSFLRKITYQELTREGLAGPRPDRLSETMAEAEGLGAHAAAVRVGLADYGPHERRCRMKPLEELVRP